MKAYLVQLSRGRDIQADEDELEIITKAIQTGSPAKLRQGIFNPSFFVSIVEDKNRVRELAYDLKDIKEHNYRDRVYRDGKEQKELPTMKPLADIFKEVQLKLPNGK